MINKTLHLKEYFSFLGNDGKDPTLELFLPCEKNLKELNRSDEKHPSLLICPGGGYAFCSEREAEPIALQFTSMGFNVFILRYSVAPHRFPSQINEVAACVELIYKNSDEWHCDTQKIAIIGFSAGGHLASHYSTMYDCKEVREFFPESKPVNASLLCYPVITAEPSYSHGGSFLNLLGRQPTESDIEYFSTYKNIKPSTPPTFIWHTATDTSVPVKNSLLYADGCIKNNVPVELHIYPYGYHGLSTSDKLTCAEPCNTHVNQWIKSAQNWLKLTFKL